ncbi:glutaredoxin-C6-like protein [Gilbertella persicaria]|uniref:glutaredoxin-C6-like protein n=1 Tax=Gilbertella persicaria TaxID=101096 RepID=UPI00221E6B15|nr:glutaredoxin-C6-like protein [Gilbertella persicaria]KAI8097811.1 glutaredoxin-C6-like protein [Gilbertella persicaria]
MGSLSSKQLSPEEMSKVEQLVEEVIKSNKIAVFSKSYCPYCVKAKNLLKELGLEFFVIELDNEANGAAIQQYLAEKTGQRTVPNIFINQQHVGGCDDLFAAKSSGKLQKLLQ